MLIGERKIMSIMKNIGSLSETRDERRALKGLKNMWFNKNTITLNLAGDFYRGRCSQKKCCIYPAALLPYPWWRPLKRTPFCPIPVSDSNFNPRNTKCMSVVKIFAFLGLEQNWAFFKGLRNKDLGQWLCVPLFQAVCLLRV